MSNRVKIKFGQIEFEAEGDSELIERERQQFFNLLPHAIAAVSPVIADSEDNIIMQIPNDQASEIPLLNSYKESKVQSYETLSALLKDKGFNTDLEKIMGVAYYLDQIKGISPFNVKDVEEALSEARQQKPGNINDCINRNITKSFLIAEKEKKDGQKAFRVSSDGIDWVQSYIPSEKSIKKPSTRKKAPKSDILSPYDCITREELNIDKYPPIKRLTDFKEKMIMVMYIFTNENKGEYFTVLDIMSIMTNIFGERATKDQVSGVFKREATWFNKVQDASNKKAYKYKMLNGAIDFATNILTQKTDEQI